MDRRFLQNKKRYTEKEVMRPAIISAFQSIHDCHNNWLAAHEGEDLHFIQNDHGTGDTEGLRKKEQRYHYDTIWQEILLTLRN